MGFTVVYRMRHSGYEKPVYWSLDYMEARNYARMIIAHHGTTYEVRIASTEVIWSSDDAPQARCN
jgi:hypothetical protein